MTTDFYPSRWSPLAHKFVLDHLSINFIAPSNTRLKLMDRMAVVEWPLCFSPAYIPHLIPLATPAQLSALCISWGERLGRAYTAPGVLTYRSKHSFWTRFDRKSQSSTISVGTAGKTLAPPALHVEDDVLAVHNDDHRTTKLRTGAANPNAPPVFSAR